MTPVRSRRLSQRRADSIRADIHAMDKQTTALRTISSKRVAQWRCLRGIRFSRVYAKLLDSARSTTSRQCRIVS